jgi:heme-degrading monooxygenase HmoA
MPVHVLVWRFRPRVVAEAEFRKAYAADGSWARLFAQAPGFIGTELMAAADGSGDFLTLDRWRSAADHAAFKRDFAQAYAALDRECEALTAVETSLGAFDSLD